MFISNLGDSSLQYYASWITPVQFPQYVEDNNNLTSNDIDEIKEEPLEDQVTLKEDPMTIDEVEEPPNKKLKIDGFSILKDLCLTHIRPTK